MKAVSYTHLDVYKRQQEDGFQSGEYIMTDKMDYDSIIYALQAGTERTDVVEIMFPEGSTSVDIAKKLEEQGVCSASEDVYKRQLNTFPGGDPMSSVFLGHLMSAVIGLPSLMGETDFSASAIGCILVLGVFQLGLGYILFTKGLEQTQPVSASLRCV